MNGVVAFPAVAITRKVMVLERAGVDRETKKVAGRRASKEERTEASIDVAREVPCGGVPIDTAVVTLEVVKEFLSEVSRPF